MNRVLATALVLSTGCAATINTDAFSYRFADNRAEDMAPVLAAMPAPSEERVTNASNAPLVVATTHNEPRAVVAIDLTSGETRWSTPLDAFTRPEILGDVVLTSVREAVVALDLASGRELWREDLEGLAYVGGTRAGGQIVFVASVGAGGGATRLGHIRSFDARSGREAWDYEIEGVLGRPQAEGGYVFVPWDRQNIAILDVATGLERARLRTTDDVIAWVEAAPQGVFYGYKGIYRLNEASASGTKTESAYRAPPLVDAPREPLVHEDGYFPTPGTRSARGRIRIYSSPRAGTGREVPIAQDRFYFVYYRYVFAFDTDEQLVWARHLDQDVINAEVVAGGLLTIGEQGAFQILDAGTGGTRWTGGGAMELASAGLDVGGFAPGGAAGEARPLRVSLAEIAGDADNRLIPARGYAVQLLAGMEEPEITRDLLDLYAQRSTPGALREAIGAALRTREVGTEFLVAALEQQYDYLADTPVPPLQLIVPALLEQRVEGAQAGLIQHLQSHETPAAVLPLVARGVVELGDESAVPPLRAFLVRYHADSTFASEEDTTLAVVSEGIFRHGGDEGRALLESLAAEPRTTGELKVAIQGIFDRETQEAEAAARAEAIAARDAATAAARAEAQARPPRLSQRQINDVFAAETDALRACVESELERNPRLGQIRLVFILENTGRTSDVQYAPNSAPLQACLEPIVNELSFPRFQQRRQRANFTVNLRSSSAGQPATADLSGGPWWARAERRAEGQPGERRIGRPWWETRTLAAQVPTGEGPPEGAGEGEGGAGEGGAGEGEGGTGEGEGGAGEGEGESPWWLPSE